MPRKVRGCRTWQVVEDLLALRPTIFVSVPRLFNKIYDKVTGGARAKGGLAAMLFERALRSKLAALEEMRHDARPLTHALWDRLVFRKVAAALGLDRCDKMISGSAPISPAVKDFFRAAFSCVFIEGWGMTETAASGTLCHPSDATNGHVGLPCSCVELKLVDVADMDYRTDVGVEHPMPPPSVPQV